MEHDGVRMKLSKAPLLGNSWTYGPSLVILGKKSWNLMDTSSGDGSHAVQRKGAMFDRDFALRIVSWIWQINRWPLNLEQVYFYMVPTVVTVISCVMCCHERPRRPPVTPSPPPPLLQMHSATKGFFCCFHALFTSVTSIHFMCLAESSNLTTFTSIILFSPSPTWFTRDLYYPLSLSPISFAFGIKVVNNCHRTWILYFGPWLLFFWFCFLVAVHLHRINFWALSSSRRQKRCRPKRLKPRLKP